ncbi:MAG: G1 family glutamic endopeptidase [Streptosporangiaceae bacterium]
MVAAATSASSAPAIYHAPHPVAAAHGFKPGGRMIRPGGTSRLSTHAAHTTAQSTNWSGYAATGGNGSFTSVSASWIEPNATCSSRRAQYASFWVGLDGYSSSSVEETGTPTAQDERRSITAGMRCTRPFP